jgi:pyruvate dehydrogenase E2 component (dihydrolipoamide acetyltransferase)
MSTIEIRVPAIGDFKDVGVVEVLVKPGDAVANDQSLVTLESDKATMDVPSPAAGTVREVKMKAGDRVKEGSLIVLLEEAATAPRPAPGKAAAPQPSAVQPPTVQPPTVQPPTVQPPTVQPPTVQPSAVQPSVVQPPTAQPSAARPPAVQPPAPQPPAGGLLHASPSVRRFARELGVDLAAVAVAGTGPHGRVLHGDVQQYVKAALAGGAPHLGGGLDLLPWPKVDFASFGPVEPRPLSRLRKIAGANLARNWAMIPHVTQVDEADVTDLEAFRVRLNGEQGEGGAKVTLLAFIMKACVAALRQFPDFNASLDGETLVLKRYFHLGFAADTPGGLVVPVVRQVDQKGVLDLAREVAELAARARAGKLSPADMQGGCFTVSSLGGIGGTAFTPIINAPEVAILGVSRAAMRPEWNGTEFRPRLKLPLSLSYDHRVVDGAAGARFTSFLAAALADVRRLLL